MPSSRPRKKKEEGRPGKKGARPDKDSGGGRKGIRRRKKKLVLTWKKGGREMQAGTKREERMVEEAQRLFGRKWRSGLRSMRRERYNELKDSHIEVKDFTDKERTLIKASLLAMGSVHKRYNTCGKEDCPCMRGGRKHGPYYYLSIPVPMEMVKAGHPRMKHFYITHDEAARFQTRIEMFRRLQDQVWEELWDEFVGSESAIFD